MEITLEKILAPRMAKKSCPDNLLAQNQNSDKPTLLLSELIEKYISTNISDGKWQKRTVPDHRNRISSLLSILGDRPVISINREDIRNFREMLKKLPPRWKEKMDKSGETAEHLAQNNSSKTLTISSINTMVEAVSSLFSWAMSEGLMTTNPAKNLSLKDEQAVIDKRQPLSLKDIQTLFSAEITPQINLITQLIIGVP